MLFRTQFVYHYANLSCAELINFLNNKLKELTFKMQNEQAFVSPVKLSEDSIETKLRPGVIRVELYQYLG